MKVTLRRAAALFVVGSVGLCAVVACSSSSSSPSTTPTGGATSCADNALSVSFSPMYSAYDGAHTFQVPVVVDGVKSSELKWGISDPDVADIASDPSTGGILLTIKKAGDANVVATAGTLCGSSALHVTSSQASDWEIGNQRYNNGVVLKPPSGGPPPDGGTPEGDGGPEFACTNCHGPTASSGLFKDVAHTPEQTAGFSDEQLQNVFRHGTIPDGGYFDTTIVTYQQWHQFHNWGMTDDEARGIIVYLRSLTPAPQEGASNFGGRFRDGGRPPPPDGGFPPGP